MQGQPLHAFIADKIDDLKGRDIVMIDVRGKSSITDCMIICSGNSNRHVCAIAEHVENALVGVQRLAEQEQAAERRRAVLAQTLGYAKDRYEAGYASYLEQIDAQRNLFQAETELVNLRQSRLDNQIALYRALGGGWSADAVLPAAAAQATAAD